MSKNKYCYVRSHSATITKGRGHKPQIITVFRFARKQQFRGDYGVGFYSAARDFYATFGYFGGKRFYTAAEAQRELDLFALENNLVHAEIEW